MNENKQENLSQIGSVQQQIKPKNVSSNKSFKFDIGKQIKKFQLFVCLNRCFKKISLNYGFCISKCSLITQFLIFLIFFSFVLYTFIYAFHYFGFERIFKFDYYYVVQNEYLNYLITDLDDIHFELSSNEIKSQFEDIDNLYFFEIYFQELISMGLLDEEPYQKIFPNISPSSENYYESYDNFQMENDINCFYTIPKDKAEQYIDNRGDCLSEIAKLYYFFLPLITYEAVTKKTYINETFLIAYEFDYKTKEVIGNEPLYFSFPVKINELVKSSNFFPTNNFISPQISKKKFDLGEKYNNSFYKDNWFIQQDFDYRLKAGDNEFCSIIFSNLNYNYYGKLNKSNIVSLQSYFHSNISNKDYIINIIYYINQKEFKEEYLEFSSFLLFNDSSEKFEINRYSDNDTFLVSNLNIAELTLLSSINEYFHYGMYDKNYNFFKYGVSFDTLNLEELGEPLRQYKTSDDLKIDLKYFSSLFLYSSLFRKLEYNITKEESKSLNEINFINKEHTIQNICNKINFTSYINYLNEEEINCFDENNLLYYSEKVEVEDIFKFNYNTMPLCICLPLYCLKNLEKDFKYKKNVKNKIYPLVDQIKLPDKCQNNFKNYLNGIDEDFKSHISDFTSYLKYNFFFNNVYIFSYDLKKYIEKEFFIYKSFIFPQIPKIIFLIITLVDNNSIGKLLSELIARLDAIKTYYVIIQLVGILVAFIIANHLVIKKIASISKVIFDFKKVQENYLKKLESNNSDKKINKYVKDNNNSNKKLEKIDYSNNHSITKIEKNIFKDDNIYYYYISNDNGLLDELSEIYRKYYRMTKEKLLKIYHDSKEIKDEKTEKIENELFRILRIFSFYIPKFKLKATMDYNFYLNSKLNLNYLKSMTKGLHSISRTAQTQSVIYELLSTEKVENCGLITNFNFKYITNVNLLNNRYNNSIKKSMFAFLDKKFKNNIEDISYNNNEVLIEGENKKDNIQIIWKEKNKIIEEFENNFENDDYLKKDKINLVFDSFLTNAYYKYIKKITYLNKSSSFEIEE